MTPEIKPHSPIMEIVRVQLAARRFSWEFQIALFELFEKVLPKKYQTTRNEKLTSIRRRWKQKRARQERRIDGSVMSDNEVNELLRQKRIIAEQQWKKQRGLL